MKGCGFGSVEIVQDMFIKTLLGVFAVPAGKGKLEKIKKSSNTSGSPPAAEATPTMRYLWKKLEELLNEIRFSIEPCF